MICVTLAKLFSFSEAQLSQLQNGKNGAQVKGLIMCLHHRVPETVAFIIIVLHMTDRSLILTVNFHQRCNWWGEGRIISPFKVTWQKWGPLRASELSFRIWGAGLQTPWGGLAPAS